MKLFSLIFICFLSLRVLPDCENSLDSSRLVIAGGSLTEIVYLLGLEEKLVAIDITSNYPEKTKLLPSIGYVRNLSTEGILSLSPTLILGEDDMGPPNVLRQIQNTGVDIKIIPEESSAKGVVNKIQCVADILGKPRVGQKKIKKFIKNDLKVLKNLSEQNKKSPRKVMLILNIQGASSIVAGRETSGDGLIKMTGAVNVMDDFEGWKPVGTEAIISANPDFILITQRGMGNFSDVKALSEHPSLKFSNAAKKGNIIAKDGMAMLGFGPRTIKIASDLAKRFSLDEL